MKRQKVQALILGRRSWGEADRLVTLFTREMGITRVLAKGVRLIPSRRGGHLEPLTRVLALVNGARDWWYLTHVETQDYFPELHEDAAALERAQHVGQLLLETAAEGEAHEEVFDFLEGAWNMFPQLTPAKQVLLELGVTMKIFSVGGILPQLDACRRCGRVKPADAVLLDSEEGGWHCLLCHDGLWGASVSLPPRLLAVLRYAAANPYEAVRIRITDEESRQVASAMRAYTAPQARSSWVGSMQYAAG
ncbi:MAG: DNA repair protein RecO [Patescibacteria group bacterium]